MYVEVSFFMLSSKLTVGLDGGIIFQRSIQGAQRTIGNQTVGEKVYDS